MGVLTIQRLKTVAGQLCMYVHSDFMDQQVVIVHRGTFLGPGA